MQSTELAEYLEYAARLQGLALEPAQRARVLLQLERFAEIAASFADLPLSPDEEPIVGLLPPPDAP